MIQAEKEVEHINCDFCKSTEFKVYDKLNSWQIVKCSNCGFIFTNPRPTLKTLPNYYQEEYFKDERHYSKFYNEDGSIKVAGIDYHSRIADIEHHVQQRGNLLEIGCARGEFLKQMKARGWSVNGVEISEDASTYAREQNHIDVFCGTLEEYKEEKLFDVICMYQTLEHVPHPQYVIERSFSLLKSGGIVVIEVPNVQAFDMKISKERTRLSYDLPRHLNHFYPSQLEKELKKCGFKTVDIDLHYPNFVLQFTEFLAKKRQGTPQAEEKVHESNSDKQERSTKYPLLRKHETWKGKQLKKVSSMFPGWKFTIIAKK
ncbi:MAG: class I SAM-dependent methyltransferase [Flammeovirgaceae bacterium]